MAIILQTTFPILFFCIKNSLFRFKFSPKFVPKGPIRNKPEFVLMMAWRRRAFVWTTLSEPMIASVTDTYMRQWVSELVWHIWTESRNHYITPAYKRQRIRIRLALVQIKACRLFGTKPLSKPLLGYCQLDR